MINLRRNFHIMVLKSITMENCVVKTMTISTDYSASPSDVSRGKKLCDRNF